MTALHVLSVVIPYYQKEEGILERALKSIKAQDIPASWKVEVIVVDDGSPRPAKNELANITLTHPLQLKVIEQQNSGVAAARNRGLDSIDPNTEIIAFLDSDDIWPSHHIQRAIMAVEDGFDFYFCDNSRNGYHKSHWHSEHLPETSSIIKNATQKTGYLEITNETLAALTLSEFPSQASTVAYKANIAKDLRFKANLKSSEDLLFFTDLAVRARRCCLDLDSVVKCSEGINIFFNNLNWDSPGFLSIKRDHIIANELIAQIPNLPLEAKRINKEMASKAKNDFAFHFIRFAIKNRGKLPQEFNELFRLTRGVIFWFPCALIYVLVGKILGFYKP